MLLMQIDNLVYNVRINQKQPNTVEKKIISKKVSKGCLASDTTYGKQALNQVWMGFGRFECLWSPNYLAWSWEGDLNHIH